MFASSFPVLVPPLSLNALVLHCIAPSYTSVFISFLLLFFFPFDLTSSTFSFLSSFYSPCLSSVLTLLLPFLFFFFLLLPLPRLSYCSKFILSNLNSSYTQLSLFSFLIYLPCPFSKFSLPTFAVFFLLRFSSCSVSSSYKTHLLVFFPVLILRSLAGCLGRDKVSGWRMEDVCRRVRER